ncbi:hypothetical protein [Paracoccus methylarcula]|nr:hypothetical protein [Paracoccus methylarcula]
MKPADVAITASASTGLTGLRRTSQGRFEQLTEVLGRVHRALHGIGGDFDRLTRLVDEVGAARGGTGALRDACSSLAELLGAAHAAISVPDLSHAIVDGLDAVETLRRECRQLNAIASMTRVTGYSLDIDAIEDYIVTLRGMIERLSSTTMAVQEGLVSIGTAVRQATGQLGTAASCARMAMDAQRQERTVPEMEAVCGSAGTLAEQLRGSTQSNTAVLMTGIQFSDAFAQRLDHIETILQAADAEPPAAALAAAQISALAADASEMLAATQVALEQLGTIGQAAADSLTGDTGAQAAQLLAGWRAELDDGHQIERLVAPALEGAMAAVENIDTVIADARGNLETLSSTALEVSLATVNAGLLARRSGSAKSAMDVLSTTVRERADACNELHHRCRSSFGRIDSHTQQADFSQLSAEAGQLSTLIARADADLALASEMFARLEAMQQAARQSAATLQHAVDDGLQLLASLPELIAEIEAHVPKGADAVLAPEDAAMLVPFQSLYTMDREREIHAGLVGETLRSATAAPVAEPQTLDDIFF